MIKGKLIQIDIDLFSFILGYIKGSNEKLYASILEQEGTKYKIIEDKKNENK